MGFLPRFLLQEFARKMLKRMNAMQRMNRSQRPHSQLVVEYMSLLRMAGGIASV